MHRGLHALAVIVLAVTAAASSAADAARTDVAKVQLLGVIRNGEVSEVSGAALSTRNPAHLFIVNDSHNSADLHAISRDGGVIGKVAVNGAQNRDWEELVAFTDKGAPWLLIADTGDNGGVRESLELIIVPEPAWPLPAAVDVARRIAFRLPEGPRDIEAVAVDAAAGRIYLIAKRHFPRVLYRLPLHPRPSSTAPLLAERIGTFNTLPPANNVEKLQDPKFGRFHGDITSFAMAPDASYALLLSYRDLYFYPRQPGQSLLRALRGQPTRLNLPLQPQREAIALDAAQRQALVLSEHLLAPIYQVSLPAID